MYYLGTIHALAGAAQNNIHTTVPFAIQVSVRQLYLQASADGVQFAFIQGDANTTAAHGAFLPAHTQPPAGPYEPKGTAPTISVWNPTGGAVDVNVYAL